MREYKQRASGGGHLLAAPKGQITELQTQRIKDLKEKAKTLKGLTPKQSDDLKTLSKNKETVGKLTPANDKKLEALIIKSHELKTLTDKESSELKELETKLANQHNLELADTSKSHVLEQWLRHEIGYIDQISNDAINKGLLCEDESIKIYSEFTGKEFIKNELSFEDDFFTGTPDILTPDIVIDIKTSQTPATFIKAHLTRLYITQLQIYMHLSGVKKAQLAYVLTNSPQYIIDRETKKLTYDFKETHGKDANNWTDEVLNLFSEAKTQILLNHTFDRIETSQRVKTFDIEYNPALIEKLKSRIKLARIYYKSIKLNGNE